MLQFKRFLKINFEYIFDKNETKNESIVAISDWKYLVILMHVILSQSAFICSKLTIETLEQGVKYIQS